MMATKGRRLSAVLGVLLLLLSIVVGGASAGLESVAAAPSDTSLQSEGNDEPLLDLDDAQACILKFLKEQDSSKKVFHVQGWRWHTMSLARDAKRLGTLASSLDATAIDDTSLEKAAYHVIEFNMKALHRIENKTFFPWLKSQLSSVEDATLAQAFQVVLDAVIENQRLASEIGVQVMEQVEMIYSPSASEEERTEAVGKIANLSADLSSRIQFILALEDTYLVPAVAILVPASKQRAFNNKVILSMGVLDSRLHLVGMHETVLEQGQEEQALFQKEIPAIPRYMIPRWKRLLYDSQASVLEEPQQ